MRAMRTHARVEPLTSPTCWVAPMQHMRSSVCLPDWLADCMSVCVLCHMGQAGTVGPPLPHTEMRLEAVPDME